MHAFVLSYTSNSHFWLSNNSKLFGNLKFLNIQFCSIFSRYLFFLCVRKTPPEFDWNRSFSVLGKHNTLQINAFIFLKNLHNPEVPGSNPGLATWKSRTYVKSWVLCFFCVRFAWGFEKKRPLFLEVSVVFLQT